MVDKLPFLSDEHHFAIAAVAARAAQLDNQIEHGIYTFLGDHHGAGAFLLNNLPSVKLLGLLNRLIADDYPGDEADIDDLFQRIAAARKQRNKLLHWVWGQSDDPSKAKAARVPPHKAREEQHWSSAEIAAVAGDLLSLTNELDIWIGRQWERIFPPLARDEGTPSD